MTENSQCIKTQLKALEARLQQSLPPQYRHFLQHTVAEHDVIELITRQGNPLCCYGHRLIIERNETYQIAQDAAGWLMIGQEGDIGYFIHLDCCQDDIYTLDLGALGSMPMNHEATSINVI